MLYMDNENIYITLYTMSEAYGKYLNQNLPKRPSKRLISLDDSIDSHN